MSLHKRAYELFKLGFSLTQIAATMGVTRQTVANWKKKERWEELLLSEQVIDAEHKEKEFLLELIKEWDKALLELKNSDLANRLTLLERYTKLYYKLKNTNKEHATTQKLKKEHLALECIKRLADLAVSKKREDVAQFFSAYSQEIAEALDGS